MPELPEVEVTRLGLSTAIVGKRVDAAAVRCVKLRQRMPPLGRILPGLTLQAIERRAKYLIWRFVDDAGKSAGWLVLHLGMTGSWRIWEVPAPPPARHEHVDIVFGRVLVRYTDPRRFGSMMWFESDPYGQPPLSELGPEPFDVELTDERFFEALKKGRRAIKQELLSGRCVVGCGNIYACEALFRAGIHPGRPADRISKPRAQRLLACIRAVLSEAIAAGGSTLRDFHGANGEDGYFALQTSVYAREGKPCTNCGTDIRRILQGARSTFYCPRCQR
jgi:formamidopyrimidine-DNA glycosylase